MKKALNGFGGCYQLGIYFLRVCAFGREVSLASLGFAWFVLAYLLFYLAGYFGLSFFVMSNRGMVEHVVSGSLVPVPWDVGVWGVLHLSFWLGFFPF